MWRNGEIRGRPGRAPAPRRSPRPRETRPTRARLEASGSSAFRVGAGRLQLGEGALEAGRARALDEDAALAGALAMLLDAPVRAVADAAGLADHEVGGGERR